MRLMIVDDEPLARMLLREYLAAHADIDIVAECANGADAIAAIDALQPDLVLLDIQMPRLSGFDVVELAGAATRYLFITAYDQYAVKAFEVRAIDYLLKPFSQQRFDAALASARATLAATAPMAAMVRQGQLREGPLERVLIRDGGHVHILKAGDIAVIEAQDDYVGISVAGKCWLKNQPLAELEAQLDGSRFLRVHRSWIVNLQKVARIEAVSKDSHVCVMDDGRKVPVSRSGYQKLRERLA